MAAASAAVAHQALPHRPAVAQQHGVATMPALFTRTSGGKLRACPIRRNTSTPGWSATARSGSRSQR